MYIKHFDIWNAFKKVLQREEKNLDEKVNLRKGEVRWVSLGVNLGSEIDGKGPSFARPCLVLHVMGENYALVAPMSTKVKTAMGYLSLEFKGEKVSVCIHQIRVISQKRILERLGKITGFKLIEIKNELKKFYDL